MILHAERDLLQAEVIPTKRLIGCKQSVFRCCPPTVILKFDQISSPTDQFMLSLTEYLFLIISSSFDLGKHSTRNMKHIIHYDILSNFEKHKTKSMRIYQRFRDSSMNNCNYFGMTNNQHWMVDEEMMENDLEPTPFFDKLCHLDDNDEHIEPFIIDRSSVNEMQVCYCCNMKSSVRYIQD